MKNCEIKDSDKKDLEELRNACDHTHKHGRSHGSANAGGGLYCMGVVGAAIYFIGQASDFWMGVLGLLKAIVWPAIMVYEAFKVLLG
jgi:hypothetical protein